MKSTFVRELNRKHSEAFGYKYTGVLPFPYWINFTGKYIKLGCQVQKCRFSYWYEFKTNENKEVNYIKHSRSINRFHDLTLHIGKH